MFFHHLDSCLKSGAALNMRSFDKQVKDWEWQWVHGHEAYPTRPAGDPVAVARELYKKYRAVIHQAYATAP
jgi:alpha-N-acetylglucosaminidase